MLSGEGLVESVHGVGWRKLRPHVEGSFDICCRLFELGPKQDWPRLLRDVLRLRAQRIATGLDGLLESDAVVSDSAEFALYHLHHLPNAMKNVGNVLNDEENCIAELICSNAGLVPKLVAHEPRRALRSVTQTLGLHFHIEPLAQVFAALFTAAKARKAPEARSICQSLILAREPLYEQMVAEAVHPEHTGRANAIWGRED
jgi:hypothetical protein